MSARDLMPYKSPLGGTITVEQFRADASYGAVIGEAVAIATTGEIQEAGDDPAAEGFAGIAMGPTSYTRNGTSVSWNPRTGATITTGDMVPVALALPGQQLITANFATDGAGTAATPTLANALGKNAGLTVATGVHYVDTGTTNELFVIVDVLDTNLNSIQDPRYANNTGVYVVAMVVNSAWTGVTTVGDPVAD